MHPAKCEDSIADAVTDTVQALVARAPKLRRVQGRLWVDTLAVCTGVRPACMLDYCPSTPARAVQAMCCALSGSLRKHLFALSWQGCLWIVSQAQLSARLHAMLGASSKLAPEAWLVDFCAADASGSPCIRPAAGDQVERHLHSMLSALAATQGGDSAASALVELQEDADIGNLPFVNGILLGYPFVYYVTADNVNRASAWLSSSALQLFRQKGVPFRCAGDGSGRSDQEQQRGGESDLWTCSAPLEAVDAGGGRVDVLSLWREWCTHHATGATCMATVWSRLWFDDCRAGQQAVVI
eukprot:jgi/Ulvmu1/2694/UM014_0150.1